MRNKAQIIWCYRRKTITLPPIEFKTIYHSLAAPQKVDTERWKTDGK